MPIVEVAREEIATVPDNTDPTVGEAIDTASELAASWAKIAPTSLDDRTRL
jgi:hypothetical protein